MQISSHEPEVRVALFDNSPDRLNIEFCVSLPVPFPDSQIERTEVLMN
jgi:hypothetical protein